MTKQVQNSNTKIFNLEERTAKFGEAIIKFCKSLPMNPITLPLIGQLIRSATSVGVNYMEADCCNSKKDFTNKIVLCKKEAKESTHWIRMISVACPDRKEDCLKFWKEAHELVLIFSAIINKRSQSVK